MEAVFLADLSSEPADFPPQRRFPDHPFDDADQFVFLDRLGEVVARPMFHGFDRRFHRPKSGHENHVDIGMVSFDLGQQFKPLHAFHAKIREDDRIVLFGQSLQSLLTASCHGYLMTPVFQHVIGQFPHICIVIDDKDRTPFFSHSLSKIRNGKTSHLPQTATGKQSIWRIIHQFADVWAVDRANVQRQDQRGLIGDRCQFKLITLSRGSFC